MTTARRAAFDVLVQVQRRESYVNLALQNHLRSSHLEPRDKALCAEIVYGTVQRQRTLDTLISLHCRRPLEALEPEILVILRMSVYQLEFLDKVPAYAVLDEGVNLAKAHKRQAGGFVNGVLRNYLRDGRPWPAKLEKIPFSSAEDRLGVELSYPTWLVRRLTGTYGAQRARRIMEASNEHSLLTVRVNSRIAQRADVLQRIHNAYGAIAEPTSLNPDGIRLYKGLDVEQWDLYQTGAVTVQDEGAMVIAPLFQTSGVSHRGQLLDMCAAPGGKATHLAELFPQAQVFAADLYAHKIELIQQTVNRLHLENVQTMTVDSRLLPQLPQYQAAFDAVLLDAPCSGLGVLRHRPDIRWRRQPEDVAQLHRLQVQLLSAAVEVTTPGGVVVYSTCTLLPEENSQVVAEVLDKYGPSLSVDALDEDLAFARDCRLDGDLGITLTPELYHTDGFFMTRLRIH